MSALSERAEVAAAIELAVRAVPGVLDLYSTGVIGPLAAVTATSVTVSVGVDATAQAPSTAADVAAAIRSVLPVGSTLEVVVRVSRVS